MVFKEGREYEARVGLAHMIPRSGTHDWHRLFQTHNCIYLISLAKLGGSDMYNKYSM